MNCSSEWEKKKVRKKKNKFFKRYVRKNNPTSTHNDLSHLAKCLYSVLCVCMLVSKKTQRKRDYCAVFPHCTCASSFKILLHTGWWWCKIKKNEAHTKHSSIWWNEKRPMKPKKVSIRTETQSSNHTIHAFFLSIQKLRENIVKDSWWCVAVHTCMHFICLCAPVHVWIRLYCANATTIYKKIVLMIQKTCVHKWNSLHKGHKISRIFVCLCHTIKIYMPHFVSLSRMLIAME